MDNKQIEEMIGSALTKSERSIEDIDEIARKVAELTDENDHFGARILIAKDILQDKGMVEVYTTLMNWHKKQVVDAVRMRDSMENVLSGTLKRTLSSDDFDKIHGAL